MTGRKHDVNICDIDAMINLKQPVLLCGLLVGRRSWLGEVRRAMVEGRAEG